MATVRSSPGRSRSACAWIGDECAAVATPPAMTTNEPSTKAASGIHRNRPVGRPLWEFSRFLKLCTSRSIILPHTPVRPVPPRGVVHTAVVWMASVALLVGYCAALSFVRPPPTSLRRAAQLDDPSLLASLLTARGCTAADVAGAGAASGRSALHHAAWRGCEANVRLLLHLGCDVNRWSTGEYSYGKTPIFYAITRCRDGIVR